MLCIQHLPFCFAKIPSLKFNKICPLLVIIKNQIVATRIIIPQSLGIIYMILRYLITSCIQSNMLNLAPVLRDNF